MAGGFKVNITLDIERFEAAITGWSKATELENGFAAIDAAEYIRDQVKETLSIYAHPYGTPTPSPPFKGVPGMIDGFLRDSVEVKVMAIPGFTKVHVGAVYARIQELGGFAGLHHMTYIPPRPYFRPTVMELRNQEGAMNIFVDHWRKAMLAAVEGILF